jgi:hypothetical protein
MEFRTKTLEMAFNFSDVSNRSESRLKQWQELCRWIWRLQDKAIFVARVGAKAIA